YHAIADDLRRRVEGGHLGPGRLLPSEAELSAELGASRVTVRKALELLRTEGLVESRQGFGWYVAGAPLRQTLGRLGTIEAQLAASGASAERRVLDFGFVAASDRDAAPDRVAALLGPGPVLRVRRLNLADGQPFARVTVWAPEAVGASLSRDDVERSSFYELLGPRLSRATQTIGAAAASAGDAEVLGVPTGSPVLRCERVTFDREGEAVLVAEHVFPALRTEFVVELSSAGDSIAPSGLRLVD
ncbi:MAG: GntR family transcriptional regulator, partial [Acidimicrobiales bacterium]